MRQFLVLVFWVFITALLNLSGQGKLWDKVNIQDRNFNGTRYITPDKFITFKFDSDRFRQIYNQASRSNNGQQMDIPMPDGTFITFDIIETPVFDDELMRKYPGYTSYTGSNKMGDRLKLSLSPFGINGMIISNVYGHVFIDPITLSDHNDTYQVYDKRDFRKKTGNFRCGVISNDEIEKEIIRNIYNETKGQRVGDCQLRSYRLALSCTGEYATFHGGTKAKVLAAYNNTMTRVNGVYEKDAGITMKLIADTDKVIYLNGSTDPFTNSDGEIMLDENQLTIDKIIGRANYDIGHVFSTGGGGIAQLRSPCSTSKAMGVTGQSKPVGDPFDVDYVAHEMGHQFGANHTQNNDCQRAGTASVEPGSASTIMGYAGICDPNIQNNSDAYFHGVNLAEIASFVVSGNGNTCAQIIPEINSKPTVSVVKSVYTIPISTSFALTASGTDSEGDVLTYCWEQIDNEVATMPPTANSNKGPSFRSVNPSISPTRYFPELSRKYGIWEVLPSVSRDMDFRCTIRDNHAKLGCTDEANVKVKTSSLSGPFLVLYPNTTSVSWLVGSSQTVTWDVARTDVAPVNCTSVDIYLSTDGGLSYPILLAGNVPNSGTSLITVPGLTTTKAKVMVKAADNVFFDVSNANFKIISSFIVTPDIKKANICNESSFTTNIVITEVQSISSPIELSILNPIATLNYNFSLNPINSLPSESELTISGLQSLPKGINVIDIQSVSGVEKIITKVELFLGNGLISPFKTINPAENAFDIDPSKISFSWESVAGTKDYTIEISSTPSFAIVLHKGISTSSDYDYSLESGKVYFWRVKPNSPCFSHPFGKTASFRTKGNNSGVVNLLINEALLVNKSSEGKIDSTLLYVSGTNRDFINFTLTKIPVNGQLFLDNQLLSLGSSFTMADIISEKIIYKHGGNQLDKDEMIFNIIDDQGRWLPDVKFAFKINQGLLGIIAYREKQLICFGDKTGSIKAEGYGGVMPYTYSLDGQNFQASATFNDLEGGSYVIYIKDDLGMIANSNTLTLVEPLEIKVQLTLDKYDILVNATGGSGNWSYSLNGKDFITEPKFIDPGNGQFVITVKDASGCLKSEEIEINIPPLVVVGNINSDVICASQSATFSAFTAGGFPPYSFSTDDLVYQVSSNFTRVPGKYVIFVKDSGGKKVISDSIFTKMPAPIVVSLMQDKLKITVIASGGTGKLQYSSTGINFNDDNILEFSDNGGYKIYVRDSLSCTKITNLTLNVLKDLSLTTRNISCHDKKDGFIKIVAINGAAPFRYSLNGSVFSSTREWSNLGEGIYKFVVKDNKNDSLFGEIIILKPDSLELDYVVNGLDLELIIKGGTLPFQFSIDNGALFLENSQFTDLQPAKYDVVVKDKNGCTVSTTILISSLNELEISNKVKVYPNPSSSLLFLSSKEFDMKEFNIQLFGVSGVQIEVNTDLIGELLKIDLGNVPPGIYLLKVINRDLVITRKVVKE